MNKKASGLIGLSLSPMATLGIAQDEDALDAMACKAQDPLGAIRWGVGRV
jgi:hypothetical protein